MKNSSIRNRFLLVRFCCFLPSLLVVPSLPVRLLTLALLRLLLLGFSLFGTALSAAAASPPNILFILVDDLAFNDLGCYAYPGNLAPAGTAAPLPFPEKSAFAAPNQATALVHGKQVSLTPTLDRLAAQGVKLTAYHSPSSVCSPSRLGLMTGRMPARFGLGGIISEKRRDVAGLPSREITLAEALKASGYATAAFGKWHLGNGERHDPTRHGFDHYWPATGERATELERLTKQAMTYIEENRAGPFFAYFAPHQPHHPNVPHPDFAGSSTKLLGPRTYLKGDNTTATQPAARSDYHDVVHELDFRLGQLFRKLDELKLTENTIVIFTSDNGPWTGQTAAGQGTPGIIGTGYPYRGGKFEFWEGGTRVPALIRYPREIPAGLVSAAPASGLDWLPTLVHRGGGTVPTDRPLDGFDLWPYLTGLPTSSSPRPYVAHERGKNVLAVSDGRFKRFENRLVDLRADQTEQQDVAATHPEVADALARQLADANTSLAADTTSLEKTAVQEIVLKTGPGRYVEVPAAAATTVQIGLLVAPTADLVLRLRVRAGSVPLVLTPAELTFTPAGGTAPQTITVQAAGTARGYATVEVVGPDSLPLREMYFHLR